MRNLHVVTGIPLQKILYRRNAMDKAFPAAKVQAPLDLVLSIQEICETAGQRKDAHVAATAVAAGATFVVTNNIRDFAASVLSYCGLSKIKPDPFCVKLLRKVEAQVLEGVRAHRASLRRTPMSAIEYVEYLANPKFGMPNLARALAPHRGAI